MNSNLKQLGERLIVEVNEASHLQDGSYIEDTILEIIKVTGATLLKMDFHHFGEGFGVTGVAILAESHISIHTWPEYSYAAIDVFLCNNVNTKKALLVIKNRFETEHISFKLMTRGYEILK
jgi:S-adenosylmethionine decarboxylase